MKAGLLCIALGVFVIVQNAKTEVNVKSALAAVGQGVKSGKQISEWLKSTAVDTTKLLARITSKIGPFLGVIGPLFTLVSILLPKPKSAEYRLMKENFQAIDNNFNKVFNRLDDVKNLLHEVKMKVDFGSNEKKLLHFIKEFRILKNQTDPKKYEAFKEHFIKKYEMGKLEESMDALYRGVVNSPGSSITGSLTKMAVLTSAYNRTAAQKFIKRIILLVMESSQIQLAYYQLTNKPSMYDIRLQQWTKQNQEMVNSMLDMQKILDEGYFKQSGKDARNFAEINQEFSNGQFAEEFHKYLSKKYDFRYWHVVVYREVSGDYKHYLKKTCPAFQRMSHMFGRNFAFVDVKKSPMPWIKKSDIQSELDNMKTPSSAKAIYKKFPKWMRQSLTDEGRGGDDTMLNCVYRGMGVVKQPDAHIACVHQRCAYRSDSTNLIFAVW